LNETRAYEQLHFESDQIEKSFKTIHNTENEQPISTTLFPAVTVDRIRAKTINLK
jgi:hypothetical protein